MNSTQLLHTRLGKVCTALIAGSPAELMTKAALALKENSFLEFRLDSLPKPALALPEVQKFLEENTAATVIATCRRSENGGSFAGSVGAEVELLVKAAQAGCQLVDLEIESAEALKKAEYARLREAGAALILSYHNFTETGDLQSVYARMERFAPDFMKVVPTARTLADNLKLMRFLEQVSDKTAVVGIAMGELGVISRVLGVRAGSAFTFAAATAGEETGPGQITARTLVETYRMNEIDAATKVYGVSGNPVNKSLSPVMLNTAFRRETVNAVYLALQTEDVADLMQLVKEVPVQGLSVTMPHKQAIVPYLEQMDPLAKKIGAVNTVLRAPDGKLYGFNTDVAGIVVPLSKRMPIKGAKVLVLGAGGSARAAVFGLKDKGAEVSILNRTPETAAKLAKEAGAKVLKREVLGKSQFDVVLNATPVGMAGQKGEPMLRAEDLTTLRAKYVFDLVYNPVDTPLIRMAREVGVDVITGVEMFVQQGARQFEIWTGKPAPEEEMLRVVVHALRQRAAETAAEAVVEKRVEQSMPKVRVKKAS